jgi:hypothetical protein
LREIEIVNRCEFFGGFGQIFQGGFKRSVWSKEGLVEFKEGLKGGFGQKEGLVECEGEFGQIFKEGLVKSSRRV